MKRQGSSRFGAAASSFLAVAVCLLSASEAYAVTLTACVKIGFLDDRHSCPGIDFSVDGARGTCSDGTVHYAKNVRFQVWDKDTLPDADDFIGYFVAASATNVNCFTFNWADTADPPDLYVSVEAWVFGPDGNNVQILENNGTSSSPVWNAYSIFSNRNSITAPPATDCTAGTTCLIGKNGSTHQFVIPSTDVNHVLNRAHATLNGASRALDVFAYAMESVTPAQNTIHMFVDSQDKFTAAEQAGAKAFASGYSTIKIMYDAMNERDKRADLSPHEFGHLLQSREWGGSTGSDCGGGWGMSIQTNEACATSEGWASYVSAATWYDPAATNADPVYNGFEVEEPTPTFPTCADNITVAGQVTRAFWDLDDAVNEAAVSPASDPDQRDANTDDILNGWGTFASGTSDRQKSESGTDGPNLWDWACNVWGTGCGTTASQFTLLGHNCLLGQTFN